MKCYKCGGLQVYSGGCNGEWECWGDCSRENTEPSGAKNRKEMNMQEDQEDMENRKKLIERKKDQIISMSDQYWELAKDRVGDLEAIRDKLINHKDLSPEEIRDVFMVLNLVIAEARLRQVLTPRS